MPIDTVFVGDTIYSTGSNFMAIGGAVPVEFKGYRFYSPNAKARLIRTIKVDPKKQPSISATVYGELAKKKKIELAKSAAIAQEQIRQKELEKDSIWYVRTFANTTVYEKDYALANPIGNFYPDHIIKIQRHSESYFKVYYRNKVGYIKTDWVYDFSRTQNPFVKTQYPGHYSSSNTSDSSPLTNTPTTGAPIHVGPRGGHYYINSNGNKTYVPRSSSSYGGGRRK
ncbi:hypothetical protein GCM10028805_54710 [Spirosoma harenae]